MNIMEYVHDYYNAGVDEMLDDIIPSYLGKADAIDEWIDDPIAAEANFVNNEAYNHFDDVSGVILAGRIGSGKTTILNKLKYSIEKGKNSKYSFVVMVDTRDYIAQLGTKIRLSNDASLMLHEIENVARKEWENAIITLAMKEIYTKYTEDEKRNSKIGQFLEQQNLINPRISLNSILEIVVRNARRIENPVVQSALTAAEVVNYYLSPSYEAAKNELYDVLQKRGRILILIDSIEKYEFNDKIVLAILNALVNLCVDYNRERNLVAIKMAAPSELIPKLSVNPGKMADKITYIRWSHDNLKAIISIRLYKYVKNISSSMAVDKEKAINFFDEYYDEYCKTRCNIWFPTFSYCIAHTQKEPRQLIAMFNAWIHYEKRFPKKRRMDLINSAIKHGAVSRIMGALSIYSSIHNEMYEMFKRTFVGRKYCFTEDDFDEWLNSCANMRGDLDAYDLKRYFISSGLVGTQIEMHNINNQDAVLKNERPIRIKEVVFEYQRKEYLSFNKETHFCLHPMVFSVLNICVDRNTLVYPKPLEFDGDYIPWDAD